MLYGTGRPFTFVCMRLISTGITTLLLLLAACQPAKIPLYRGEAFQLDTLANPPQVPALFTAYLVGDAGDQKGAQEVLALLKEQLKVAPPQRSAVFYLGDNIYPAGLPDSTNDGYGKALATLRQQAAAVEDFAGPVWWLPGNHDWGQPSGDARLHHQAAWVESLEQANRQWTPPLSHPFWALHIMGNEVVLITLDSERWLRAEEPEVFAQMQQLIDTLKPYAKFPKILLTHHPAYSDGPHGGRFGFRQHLFPLTDVMPWAYLPMPGVGSLYPLLRSTIGHPQDISHGRYWKLTHVFNGLLSQYSGWMVVSGHEHAMQYIQTMDDHHLIIGSGSKTEPVYPRAHSVFAYSGKGLLQLRFLADKSVWATFWRPDAFEARGVRVFFTKLQ